MNYRQTLILGILSLTMACNQTAPQTNTPQVLGMLELGMNDAASVAKFRPTGQLATRAVVTENQIVIAPTGIATVLVETNGPRNFDYVSRDFTITNNTGAALNNLTLVALAQATNLGGVGTQTAIKSATAFNGTATSNATAILARATHAMTSNLGNIVVDDAINKSRASFQAMTAAEASTIQNDANFVPQVSSGTVLEYGFVATDNAQTSRTIANGATGKFTVAMRFPKGTGAGTYSFIMTFVVATMPSNRVTRSPEESTANANARATAIGNATDKVLIDDPAINTSAGYSVLSNIKTGVGASQILLKNAAKLVVARVSAGGGYDATSVYNSDFVEIFNLGEFSANLSGKSLQYARFGRNLGTDFLPSVNTINVTTLGIVSPGGYRLVSTNSQNAGTASPTTETAAGWATGFNFANGGTIALVNQTTALGCGLAASPCSPGQSALILDLLGFKRGVGIEIIFEGTVFAYPTDQGNLAFSRANNSCTDTNNNNTDFAVETMTNTSARNSSTTAFICP
jgi:hypothetical protein